MLFWFSCFWQLRARDPASRGDRYMLVTFDDPPYGVKVISNWYNYYTVKPNVFFCQWDFIVLLVCSQCRAVSRWRKKTAFFAPNTRRPGAALPPNIQQTFCFCVEKTLGRRDGGGEIYYRIWRRSFFDSTMFRLVKETANQYLTRPLYHPRFTIGQCGLKVDKPSSSWDFFLYFLWVR